MKEINKAIVFVCFILFVAVVVGISTRDKIEPNLTEGSGLSEITDVEYEMQPRLVKEVIEHRVSFEDKYTGQKLDAKGFYVAFITADLEDISYPESKSQNIMEYRSEIIFKTRAELGYVHFKMNSSDPLDAYSGMFYLSSNSSVVKVSRPVIRSEEILRELHPFEQFDIIPLTSGVIDASKLMMSQTLRYVSGGNESRSGRLIAIEHYNFTHARVVFDHDRYYVKNYSVLRYSDGTEVLRTVNSQVEA